MPVKLTYFPARGAAELTRLILAFGEIEYEDERVKGDQWRAGLKQQSPLGSMPFLTLEDGSQYAQSTAIARYFAHKVGIAGKTEEEKLQADMIVDLVKTDMQPMLSKIHFQKDEQLKQAQIEEAKAKIDNWLENIEAKFIKGEGSVLERGLSWADLALFGLLHDMYPALLKCEVDPKFVKVHKLVAKVKAEPTIAAWISKRPQTEM